MSSKTAVRTVNVRIKDDTVSGLLATARVVTSLAREIHMLQLAYKALADSELMAKAAAGDFTAIATLEIRTLGIFGGGARVGAAIGLAGGGGVGIIPVGQTRGGEARMLTSSGPVWGHVGETLGRLSPPEKMGGGGDFSVNVQQLTLARDGEDAESVGRSFAHIRAGVLSTDVPAS